MPPPYPQRDVLAIRRLLEDNDADIEIIAKIENKQGLITRSPSSRSPTASWCAGIWGEIPTEEVPLAQKHMIAQCNKQETSNYRHPDAGLHDSQPSAHAGGASDVANAIFDGTDAIMLSGNGFGKIPGGVGGDNGKIG